MNANQSKKIAWGICGAGHFLRESVQIVEKLTHETSVFLSEAAIELLVYYRLGNQLHHTYGQLITDDSASCREMTALYQGDYRLLVIAPATANTVAKMAHGIADTLITNLFAQAGKLGIPTLVLPCDTAAEIVSPTPDGSSVLIRSRQLDLDNNIKLSRLSNVTVVECPQALEIEVTKVLSELP